MQSSLPHDPRHLGANNPVIGYYVQHANEIPPFVLEDQILPRPIVSEKPKLHELSYTDILGYLLWDDADQTTIVWMDVESFTRFAAMFEQGNNPSQLVLEHRHIADGSVQVWISEAPLEHV